MNRLVVSVQGRSRDRVPGLVAALVVLVLTAPAAPVRGDLISHWPFDGNLEDVGIAGNEGFFFGDVEPFFVEGYDGTEEGAILFDGIDDYVLVDRQGGLPLYAHPQFSVAMWVQGGVQNDKRIWSESSSANRSALFNLGTQRGGATGQFDLFVRDANGATAANHFLSEGEPFDETWHHLAWVDDNGVARLYIDGVLDPRVFDYGRPDLTAGLPDVEIDIATIGGILRDAPCCLFTGAIDDVRIYDHALSAEEIAALVDPDRACPAEGDTHCGELDVAGPDGGVAGNYTVTVTGASDESGDDIAYTFAAENDAGERIERGPQSDPSTVFNLPSGSWTITAVVDDDPLCFDAADDATCSVDIDVVDVPRMLLGHWTFDGTLEDASGNGNEGEPQTGLEPAYVEGHDGEDPGAVSLNGIDDLVVVKQNTGLPLYQNEAFSIAMWVKGLPQPDYRVWSEGSTLSRTPLFNIGTENTGTTGQVDLFIRDAGGATPLRHVLSTREAFDGTWHHLVWVDDQGNAVLYIDGTPDATDFTYARPPLELDTTTIGGILRDTPSHWFMGEIDDVRVYNYAISEAEIADLVKPAECPAEGDTHCDNIVVEGPQDDLPGTWTFTALDADDDSGDPILYLWTITGPGGGERTVGPQADSALSVSLGSGTWTVSVTVDDNVFCEDQAADATCTVEVEVAAVSGDFLSHWPLDGSLDDVRDVNHGTFLGGDPLFVDGADGTAEGAVSFDGIDDVIEVSQSEELPLYAHPAFSIAMWVKGMPQADKRVWSEGSNLSNAPLFNIGTDNTGATGVVDFFLRSEEGTIVPHRHSVGVAFDGEWHHIAWVDEGGAAVLYIDGERDAADFSYVRPDLELNTTTIGGILRADTCCFFTGEIDDVRVYTFALSADEVAELAAPVVVEPSGFVRGDVNSDGSINITDGINILGFLFLGDAEPPCLDAADVNDDGRLQLTDAVGIFNWLFLGFAAPGAPSPTLQTYPASDCGEDPSADDLGCGLPGPVCRASNG